MRFVLRMNYGEGAIWLLQDKTVKFSFLKLKNGHIIIKKTVFGIYSWSGTNLYLMLKDTLIRIKKCNIMH